MAFPPEVQAALAALVNGSSSVEVNDDNTTPSVMITGLQGIQLYSPDGADNEAGRIHVWGRFTFPSAASMVAGPVAGADPKTDDPLKFLVIDNGNNKFLIPCYQVAW